MLKKYPLLVGGIGTKVVTPASTNYDPLAEMFMKRMLARESRPSKQAKDPYGDSKLDATYGEGLARQMRIDQQRGTINYYRGLYGPDMEHVVNNIPEVKQAYSQLDSEFSEGAMNAYKRNRESVDNYQSRIGKEKAGDQYALQYIHQFGIGSGQAPTYGDVGGLMYRSPDLQANWKWYNQNHSTTGGDEAVGKILDQFKNLGETQRKQEAYTVGSIAVDSLKGLYDIPGIKETTTAVPGSDKVSNKSQVAQRQALVVMDENMMHGLEQGYMTWLKQGGYFDHIDGAELVETDEDGKQVTYKPSSDKYIATGKGQITEGNNQMALRFSSETALFDKNGKPNENYFKGFGEWVEQKLNHAAAGFITDKRVTLNANSSSSFKPLEGDALAEAMRKKRLEALLQSGLYSLPFADQVVTDPSRDLDELTGGGLPQDKMNEQQKQHFGKMLDIISIGASQGFITSAKGITDSRQMREYLAKAPKNELDYINLELGIAGLPAVANAYQMREKGVDGEFQKSDIAESPTPALNGELLYSTRQRYRMGNDEWLIPQEKLGGMPLMLGGLPKDPRNLPQGAHYELGQGFVMNTQSAEMDASGNFRYDQTAGELNFKDDIQKWQYLSSLSPEEYKAQFGNWGPMAAGLSTALVANQGTLWIPKEEAQGFVDKNLVWAPKKWKHTESNLAKVDTQTAREHAAKNGARFDNNGVKGSSMGPGLEKGVLQMHYAGKTYVGDDAITKMKTMYLDDNLPSSVAPGTANHTGQRKTMQGNEDFEIDTYTYQVVDGKKLPARGPKIKLKGDEDLMKAYGKLQYKTDENGREYIGFDARLNNNDVLEKDADMLNVLMAGERQKAKNKPKSKVIVTNQ